MLRSMTGFGRSEAQADGRSVVVELKSVNHRYLDVGMRLPRALSFLEAPIRAALAEKIARGHIDVYVNYTNTRSDSKSVELDLPLLFAYRDASERARQALATETDKIALIDMLRFPDVCSVVEAEDDRDAVTQLCVQALFGAADALIAMRAKEGDALGADLRQKAAVLSRCVDAVESLAANASIDHRDKLRTRIEELLAPDVKLDAGRLENEIAYLADHASVDEEIVRFRSHIEQLTALLGSEEPAGRKLDFLVQELNREANTIGSKSADAEITRVVIDMKAEIEKIREQVQNLE